MCYVGFIVDISSVQPLKAKIKVVCDWVFIISALSNPKNIVLLKKCQTLSFYCKLGPYPIKWRRLIYNWKRLFWDELIIGFWRNLSQWGII
ncbi:MAG: hypothetical protein DRJ10_01900 [Bacteroidetes bacterium]|nr:MAG: hypothetical protein DRI74_08890 [Bacteroidota bacterium]RLD84162.1 MAG: hypothetical protein DRJ10_01900 [Bacteroidota bacterium]